jgi:hypothetical protein
VHEKEYKRDRQLQEKERDRHIPCLDGPTPTPLVFLFILFLCQLARPTSHCQLARPTSHPACRDCGLRGCGLARVWETLLKRPPTWGFAQGCVTGRNLLGKAIKSVVCWLVAV